MRFSEWDYNIVCIFNRSKIKLLFLIANSGRVQPIPTKATVSKLSPSSPPLVLTPDDDNFHEIRAMDFECSAFLDILSPPYHESEDEVRPGENVRNCTYFR